MANENEHLLDRKLTPATPKPKASQFQALHVTRQNSPEPAPKPTEELKKAIKQYQVSAKQLENKINKTLKSDLTPVQRQKALKELQTLQEQRKAFDAKLEKILTPKPAPTPKPGKKKTAEEEYQASQKLSDDQLSEKQKAYRANVEEKPAAPLYSPTTATSQQLKVQQTGRVVANNAYNAYDKPVEMANSVQTTQQLTPTPDPKMVHCFTPAWMKEPLRNKKKLENEYENSSRMGI